MVLFLLKLNVLLNRKMHVLSKMASQDYIVPAIEPASRKGNDRGQPTAEAEAPYDDLLNPTNYPVDGEFVFKRRSVTGISRGSGVASRNVRD